MAPGLHGLHHAHKVVEKATGTVTGKKINWWSILAQFVIGGTIVAVVSYIVSHASTKVAALVYSLPLTYVPVLLFVWKHAEKEKNPFILQEYAGQSLAGILLLVLFLAALYWLTAASLIPDENGVCPTSLSTTQFVRNLLLALLFMAVPMMWFYYFVCDKPIDPGAQTPRTCYFG